MKLLKNFNYIFVLVIVFCFFQLNLKGSSLSDETDAIIFDDFKIVEGLEVDYLQERRQPLMRLLQLSEGSVRGKAEDYFFEPSAKYDITFLYVDGERGKSSIDVIINGRSIGGVLSGSSNTRKEHTIKGINVQKRSKIELEFTGDQNGGCRFEKLAFTPVGVFEGEFEDIEKPLTPYVFETVKDRLEARNMVPDFVNLNIERLKSERYAELSDLKSPGEWRARQKEIRRQLPEFFGEFPEKTPLNPVITGKLDRDKYVIENVIFESQPDYYVPANLYIPKDRKFPVPGIIFTCGHSANGKALQLYHETCLGLVLKGYVVLAFDPMGQGERSEYFIEETKRNTIGLSSPQHMYLARTSFFVDWTFSGLRVWDGIRAIDYLVSRSEVDKAKLGVVGNSGGGQMSFLIAAVDERIKVCVAAHPGGPMENLYLKGFGWKSRSLIDRKILSLIPPRPCRVIVGRDSGEESIHGPKFEDMQLFYKGLGCEDHGDFVLVDGVHNMKQAKREPSYEWFNKWFDKEEEGKIEPTLQPEKERDLWCTESGFTLISEGGETGQTLNAKRLNDIYKPSKNASKLKENIANRLGLIVPENDQGIQAHNTEKFSHQNITIEKFTYESEEGIIIPSVLFLPDNMNANSPVYLYVSDKGKPRRFDDKNIPCLLAQDGSPVMAIDVRGTGETSPTSPVVLDKKEFSLKTPADVRIHYIVRWVHDEAATQSTTFGRTMTGMRTLDVLNGIKLLSSREDIKGRNIVVIGEGSGGICALLSAVFNPNVNGVVTLRTLPSYKLLVTNKYYDVWDYFWVPGVLRDFDIPDLVSLVSPKPQLWIDPVNSTGRKFNYGEATPIIGSKDNLHLLTPYSNDYKDVLPLLKTIFH